MQSEPTLQQKSDFVTEFVMGYDFVTTSFATSHRELLSMGGYKQLSSWLEAETHNMIVQLDAHFAKIDDEPTIHDSVVASIDVPRTWWDHFKMRFLPGWKRNMDSIDVHHRTLVVNRRICPHIDVPTMKKDGLAVHVGWLSRDGRIPSDTQAGDKR